MNCSLLTLMLHLEPCSGTFLLLRHDGFACRYQSRRAPAPAAPAWAHSSLMQHMGLAPANSWSSAEPLTSARISCSSGAFATTQASPESANFSQPKTTRRQRRACRNPGKLGVCGRLPRLARGPVDGQPVGAAGRPGGRSIFGKAKQQTQLHFQVRQNGKEQQGPRHGSHQHPTLAIGNPSFGSWCTAAAGQQDFVQFRRLCHDASLTREWKLMQGSRVGGFGAKAPTDLDPDYDEPRTSSTWNSTCRTEPVRVNCELGAMPHGASNSMVTELVQASVARSTCAERKATGAGGSVAAEQRAESGGAEQQEKPGRRQVGEGRDAPQQYGVLLAVVFLQILPHEGCGSEKSGKYDQSLAFRRQAQRPLLHSGRESRQPHRQVMPEEAEYHRRNCTTYNEQKKPRHIQL
ncbi:hypothetical protein AK812_SmicGene8750 [Symbiodinium microadriaticum]|uniref:Uncharacterized protein n=1 Tax=Symbiodinium microadriaticum TaxID=2951 RepID=A0A1Q9EK16_SYMMI|nr:hypothetical protein AK812_SmicGene8750 [Symbiodinium microadriaticum]CAE7881383.1 unnamed protein product [Symbiodinium microadriaticum]